MLQAMTGHAVKRSGYACTVPRNPAQVIPGWRVAIFGEAQPSEVQSSAPHGAPARKLCRSVVLMGGAGSPPPDRGDEWREWIETEGGSCWQGGSQASTSAGARRQAFRSPLSLRGGNGNGPTFAGAFVSGRRPEALPARNRGVRFGRAVRSVALRARGERLAETARIARPGAGRVWDLDSSGSESPRARYGPASAGTTSSRVRGSGLGALRCSMASLSVSPRRCRYKFESPQAWKSPEPRSACP